METNEEIVLIIKEKNTMAFSDHPPILRKDINDAEWTDTKAVLVTIMSIINVFMFFGNILSIVTICYTPKLRKQVSYWFVLNLAVIDLVISITVVPINTMWEYNGTWPFTKTTCEFFTFADISFSTISAYSIVLVSIDKYMYITYSIHYYDKMTRKVAVIMIVVVWIMVFIFATVSIVSKVGTDENFEDHFLVLPNNTHICVFVMTDAYVLPLVIFSFFVPFLILCFTTSRITCIASKHIKKIHAVTISLNSDTDSVMMPTSDKSGKPRRHTFNGEEESPFPQHKTSLRKGCSDMNIYNAKQHTISTIHEGNINFAMTADDNEIFNERKFSQQGEHAMEENHCCTTLHIENGPGQNERKALQLNQSSESLHIQNISSAKQTEGNTGFKDTESLGPKESSVSKISKETLKRDKEKKITYASFKEQSFGNNVQSSFQASVSHQSKETAEQFQTTSNIDNKPEDHDEPITKIRTESMRTIKLRQTHSLKTVLKRTSPYCKLFGTVTIVILCFILMFAPYNVATVIDVPCHCIEPWVYEDVLAVLYYMHSLVNPYIYMATDRKYKMALKILYRRVKMKIIGLFRA